MILKFLEEYFIIGWKHKIFLKHGMKRKEIHLFNLIIVNKMQIHFALRPIRFSEILLMYNMLL